MRQWILLAALMGLTVDRAAATLISSGDGSGNTAAPADDPGFASIGSRSGGAAIYLGDGWVLTATHIGAGPTVFGGVNYTNVPASAVQLTNPTGQGLTTLTDLVMYRIFGNPDLPDLDRPTISAATPPGGGDVVMIGRGRDREASVTNWNSSWMEVAFPSTFSGYKWLQGQSTRWGTNVVHQSSVTVKVLGVDVKAFTTRFDKVGTPDEGQAAIGDSGGSVFYKNPATDDWELSGIMHAIQTIGGQPAETAVFTNLTFSSDLSIYRSQILTINPLPGDLNLDFVVDIFNVNEVSANWGGPGPAGDANKDGIVDIFDINFVSSHWTPNSGGGAGLPAGASAVPEPTTAGLLAAGLLVLVPLASRRWLARKFRRDA